MEVKTYDTFPISHTAYLSTSNSVRLDSKKRPPFMLSFYSPDLYDMILQDPTQDEYQNYKRFYWITIQLETVTRLLPRERNLINQWTAKDDYKTIQIILELFFDKQCMKQPLKTDSTCELDFSRYIDNLLYNIITQQQFLQYFQFPDGSTFLQKKEYLSQDGYKPIRTMTYHYIRDIFHIIQKVNADVNKHCTPEFWEDANIYIFRGHESNPEDCFLDENSCPFSTTLQFETARNFIKSLHTSDRVQSQLYIYKLGRDSNAIYVQPISGHKEYEVLRFPDHKTEYMASLQPSLDMDLSAIQARFLQPKRSHMRTRSQIWREPARFRPWYVRSTDTSTFIIRHDTLTYSGAKYDYTLQCVKTFPTDHTTPSPSRASTGPTLLPRKRRSPQGAMEASLQAFSPTARTTLMRDTIPIHTGYNSTEFHVPLDRQNRPPFILSYYAPDIYHMILRDPTRKYYLNYMKFYWLSIQTSFLRSIMEPKSYTNKSLLEWVSPPSGDVIRNLLYLLFNQPHTGTVPISDEASFDREIERCIETIVSLMLFPEHMPWDDLVLLNHSNIRQHLRSNHYQKLKELVMDYVNALYNTANRVAMQMRQLCTPAFWKEADIYTFSSHRKPFDRNQPESITTTSLRFGTTSPCTDNDTNHHIYIHRIDQDTMALCLHFLHAKHRDFQVLILPRSQDDFIASLETFAAMDKQQLLSHLMQPRANPAPGPAPIPGTYLEETTIRHSGQYLKNETLTLRNKEMQINVNVYKTYIY